MESYDEKSEEVASDAERMAAEGDRVDEHIKEAKRDWESKQGDSGVPGAVPDPAEDEERSQEAESERGESTDGAGQ